MTLFTVRQAAGRLGVGYSTLKHWIYEGRMYQIPVSAYPRLEQGGVILKDAADLDAARAFRGFLLSADGQAILKQYGFAPPDR